MAHGDRSMSSAAEAAGRLAEVSRLQCEAVKRGAWEDVTRFDAVRWKLLEDLVIGIASGSTEGILAALEEARIWSEACAVMLTRRREEAQTPKGKRSQRQSRPRTAPGVRRDADAAGG
jgi:hypothetical protein